MRSEAEAAPFIAVVVHSHKIFRSVTLQNLNEGAFLRFNLNCKVRVAVEGVFILSVEYLPIDKPAVSRKTDTTRAYPPLGERIYF